jgi:hypothetical protein
MFKAKEDGRGDEERSPRRGDGERYDESDEDED